MKRLANLIPLVVVFGIILLVSSAASRRSETVPEILPPTPPDDLARTVSLVDAHLEQTWQDDGLIPSPVTEELHLLRRLSLSLLGTIPSLQEIREFEADTEPNRISRWTARLLADQRFSDYMAERLARAYVGTENGQFIVFRRDRFVEWLSEQLRDNRPYNQLVNDLISDTGLWTGRPATNFVTAAIANGELDENKLAARSVRAFLGQRIDCAQCHDHPFDDWKQDHFEGLAAWFGQTNFTAFGVEEKTHRKKEPVEYEVEDRLTLETRVVNPTVPFHTEWLPDEGTRRERLAKWVTHPENRRFGRAIANRLWALLFGRPYYATRDVDDLPNPKSGEPDLLDLLAEDFERNQYDLKRMIQIIVSTKAYQLASDHPDLETDEQFQKHEEAFAIFPRTRLRPEQVIGAMLQAGSIKTINKDSHLIVRLIRFFRENDFVREYGDRGADELDNRSETVAQSLLLMNGKLTKEIGEANFFSSCGRITALSPESQKCLEAAFQICLTRLPTENEFHTYHSDLENASTEKERERVMEDFFWSLFNLREFSCLH